MEPGPQGSAKLSLLGRAVRDAYGRGQEDEALEPIVLADPSGRPIGRPEAGDAVIFYDLRGEREVELTRSLTDEDFSHFPVRRGLGLHFVTMIEYSSQLRVKVAFPPQERLGQTLVEVLTRAGLRPVKIAESEKAVHVGFFLNGKREEPFAGERRVIVPSPSGDVSYALRPEMSAREVGQNVLAALDDETADVIIANLANVDVVGHLESREAVLAAVETVDSVLGQIAEAAARKKAALIVTADHGTVEDWLYPDGSVNTGHTRSRVPFILADFGLSRIDSARLKPEGELADVAPTVLRRLGVPAPEEMTGKSLVDEGAGGKEGGRSRLLLLILDGWGMREEKEGNMIAQARTPNFDRLWSGSPHALLEASGEAVGMPAGTVGNSEAGHFHLGAGRRVPLDLVRIDRAVEDGSFASNAVFAEAMDKVRREGRALHLMGIVSRYSSHGALRHLFALLRLARDRGLERVYIHGFIGRRGELPESGAIYIEKVDEECRRLGCGRLVTVMGRFWPLDREENWDRVRKAYEAIVFGRGRVVRSPENGSSSQ
ncbi:MAG: phosphoglycerate mutase [Candidatus Aminicenantes bacterium RBG_13_63_10]|nr:MAG: phosphoglycerate mutase [Candidatus Aminicenantes bacterium RBG_13_63_10]